MVSGRDEMKDPSPVHGCGGMWSEDVDDEG